MNAASEDGAPRRPRFMLLPRSLRYRLLLFLLAAMLSSALIQGMSAYRNALMETDEIFDYQMQQVALSLRAGMGTGLPLPLGEEQSIDLIVQLMRAADGRRLISAIVQVTGIESGRIQLQELFLGQAGPPAVFTGCGLMPDGFSGAAALDARLFSQRSVRQGQAALADAAQGSASCSTRS